jgi:hypothetical protein
MDEFLALLCRLYGPVGNPFHDIAINPSMAGLLRKDKNREKREKRERRRRKKRKK